MAQFTLETLNIVVAEMRNHYSKFDSRGNEQRDYFDSSIIHVLISNTLDPWKKYLAIREMFLADMNELLQQAEGSWFGPSYERDAKEFVEMIRSAEWNSNYIRVNGQPVI